MASIKASGVLDSYLTMVEGGSGNGERIYTAFEESLKLVNAPQVTWSRGEVNTGMFTTGRPFFIVKHSALAEYTMYLYARDLGQHLDCGWFLTVEPGKLKKALSKYMAGNPNALSQSLSVFAQQDLSAWKFIVHRSFVKCLKELMEELNQDVSAMNTQSKGYLSVW